jgi:hypothetical protein
MANFTTTGSDTFPNGMVRQAKCFGLGYGASNTTSANFPSSAVGFDVAIIADSDVLAIASGTAVLRSSNTDLFVHMFFCGGGFGSTTSGVKFHHNLYTYLGQVHCRIGFGGQRMDTSPGSTTPTYQCYFQKGSYNVEFENSGDGNCGWMTIMEVLQ